MRSRVAEPSSRRPGDWERTKVLPIPGRASGPVVHRQQTTAIVRGSKGRLAMQDEQQHPIDYAPSM